MSTSAIRFYFDFISPYAYVAWTQLPRLAARHGRSLEPVPIVFAALLNAHGQKGPAEIPAKREFTYRDVCRKAVRLGLEAPVPPPAHPFNPLLALRLASLPMEVATRVALIDALFAATWRTGEGVEAPAVLTQCLRTAGLEPENALREAVSVENKNRLRVQTEAALACNVFGVPTMIVDDELFWGVDNLELLDGYLAGDPAMKRIDVSRWATLEASARR